jgi:hypothetical protein
MSNGIFGGNVFDQTDSPFVNAPARRLSATAASGLGDAGVLTGNIFRQADSPFVSPPAKDLSVRAASGFGIFDAQSQNAYVNVQQGEPMIPEYRQLTRSAAPMGAYYPLPPVRVPMRGVGTYYQLPPSRVPMRGCGCNR